MDHLNGLSDPICKSAFSAPNISKAELETMEYKPVIRRNKSDIFKSPTKPSTDPEDKLIIDTELIQTIDGSKRFASKLLLITLIGQLVGCTIAIMLYLFILFPLTNKSSVVNLHLVSSSTVPPVRNGRNEFRRLNFSLKPIPLKVESYIEYQSKMYAMADNQPVSVIITLNSMEDWPKQAQLARAQQVTALEFQGMFTTNMLIFMLGNVINLTNLTVIDSGLGLCFSDATTHEIIALPKLRYLEFSNFTTCSNVYSIFANNVEMRSLRQLKVENGIIEQVNVNYVLTIIIKSKNSLRKLCFPDTKWEVVLLNNRFPVIPNLNTFRIDYLSGGISEPSSFLNTKISKIFPKLLSFYAIKGFASWNDFRNLLNSTSLKVLRSGIKIPDNRNDFQVYFLKNSFPSLEEVHLTLYFNITKGKTKNCFVDGLNSVKNNFQKFEIETNCDIQLNQKLNYDSRRAQRLRF